MSQANKGKVLPFPAPEPTILGTIERMIAACTTLEDIELFNADFRQIRHTLADRDLGTAAGMVAVRMYQIRICGKAEGMGNA